MHPSFQQLWTDYQATLSVPSGDTLPVISAWHFCDNKQDADECAQLVLAGDNQVTTPSVWELEACGEKIPDVGDLHIVTDWEGIAQCIIQTNRVKIVPFNQVSPEKLVPFPNTILKVNISYAFQVSSPACNNP